MSVMEAHLLRAQNNPFLAELNAQWSCGASWDSKRTPQAVQHSAPTFSTRSSEVGIKIYHM